jgi:hypothetical protein
MVAPFPLNSAFTSPAYNTSARTIVENTVSNSTSIVVCSFIAVETLFKSFPWERVLFAKRFAQ